MPTRRPIRLERFARMRLGKVSLLTLGTSLLVVLSAFYFLVVNISANKGVTLRTLELKREALAGESERLAVEAARLKSLAVIDQNASSEIEITVPEENQKLNEGKPGLKTVSLGPKLVPITSLKYLPQVGPLAQR